MDEIQYSRFNPITIIRHLVRALVLVFFVVIIISVFYQVLMRYVFGSPPSWTEEISRYSLVWLIFLASSMCIRKSRHFNVDYITQIMSRKILYILTLFLNILIVLFLSIVFYYGLFVTRGAFGTTSPALGIQMGYVQLIFPIGVGVNLMEVAIIIYELLKYGPDRVVSYEN